MKPTNLVNSSKFYSEHQNLKASVIITMKHHLGRKKHKFSDSFNDEANNRLVAINSANVFFEDFGGKIETYPIHQLGIEDALYILSLIE